jgi:hypothetical protein
MNYYYIIEYPKNKSYKIEWKVDKQKTFQKTFNEFNEYKTILYKNYENDEFKKCRKDEDDLFLFFSQQYIYHVLFRTHENVVFVVLIDFKNGGKCCLYEEKMTRRILNIHKNKNMKYKKIVSTVVSSEIYKIMKKMNYCKRQKLIYKSYIRLFIELYDILEIGGNFYFHFFSICDSKDIEIIYLLSLLFDKIIIIDSIFIQCIGYRGETKITKQKCNEILKHKNFNIKPKINEDELNQYFYKNMKLKNNGLKLCLTKNKNKLYEYWLQKGLISIIEHDYNSRYLSYFLEKCSQIIIPSSVYQKKIYKILNQYYKKKVNELLNIINKMDKLKRMEEIKILEIGFSFGIYAKALVKNKKILLDVVENRKIWNSLGIKYIEKYKDKINYYNENPTTFLPELLFQKNTYNYILFTNTELFDIQMIQIYYSLKLLNIHNLPCLIIEKSANEDLLKYIDYIKINFKFLELIDNEYFYIFKRLKMDNRNFTEYYIY